MPQFTLNYCAYHQNQQLTNFCRCMQCLLPVCPTCIKVHSEQHMQKGTHPEFQKLDSVFAQVYESSSNILQGLERLKQQLLQVQKVKKQNQSLILQKIKLYRNKLIRQFQRMLIQVQHQIVQKFQQQDQNLIQQIQQIDIKIQKIQHLVQEEMLGLQNEEGLRRMIFSLSENYEIRWLKELTGMNQRIKDMLKRNLYLEVEEDRVDEVKQAVIGYMKLGVIQWGTASREKGQKRQELGDHYNNAELTAFAREDQVLTQKSINSGQEDNQAQNVNKVNISRNRASNHYYA